MKKQKDDNQRMEEWFINELLQKNLTMQKAPAGFTNRLMQKISPTQGLSPALKKPILDIKGKLTALAVFILLFLAGLSVGHELTAYAGLDILNEQMAQIFKLDYTIMLTIILCSFTILLIFNELLKKYFVRR